MKEKPGKISGIFPPNSQIERLTESYDLIVVRTSQHLNYLLEKPGKERPVANLQPYVIGSCLYGA
ncbi:hypothetical protein SAMN02982927_01982 [Sporolactobacillus nakayamae]|uniref:Uncharacterized protein n=1 Tax=Sporolactobacillus nakayamae TaxID=269670 RepID=A0A1I2SKX3_9BACL|nr:hypothetical protein SAMN02982927_01982 [Sporolactobacillus nakayamae]